MKRLFAALICAMMLATMFIPVSAAEPGVENFIAEIGRIPCPYGTPAIDGTVNAGEGWSEAKYFDETSIDGGWGGEDIDVKGNLYRAYDETNLYIAADIIIPELSLSTSEDWIEGNDEVGNSPGWDGDVFILSIDPLQELLNAGFVNDPSVWYCFGIFEGNIVKAFRTQINNGDVSDIITSAGAVTDGGWRFEAAIPWETICEDIDNVSFGEVTLTPEDILQDGNDVSCSMIYYDRRYDPEAEERITYSRYVSICTTCPDGNPGTVVTPWIIQAHGIHLIIEGVTDDTTPAPDNTTTAPIGSDSTEKLPDQTEVVTDEKGQAVTDASGNKVTQKVPATTKKQNTGSSAGGSSAQTYDIGLAIAIGAFATSGIVFVATKKRK